MSQPIRSVQPGVLLLPLSGALGAAATHRASPHIQAEQPPPGQLKGHASVENNLDMVISVDDRGMSFMFSNFGTTLTPGDALTASQTQSFIVPVDSAAKKPLHLLLQLDGSVNIIGDCSVTLIIRAGGKTRVVDLLEEMLVSRSTPASQEAVGTAPPTTAESPESEAAPSPPANKQSSEFLEVHDPFFFEFAYSVPPNSQNPVTITVLIERNEEAGEVWAYVPIYSLSLVIIEPDGGPAVSAESTSSR